MVSTNPHVFSLNGLHPDYLTSAIHGAELKTCHLTKTPRLSAISRVICAEVTLDLLSIGPALMTQGTMPDDCFTMIFVDRCPGLGRAFNFSTDHSDGFMGLYHPGAAIEAYSPAGLRDAVLSVCTEIFLEAISDRMPDFPERILKEGAAMRVGLVEQNALRCMLRLVEESVIDPAQPLTNEAARRQLQCDILDAFLAALGSGCSMIVPTPGIRVARRYTNFRKLTDYVTEHSSQIIYVADLAHELGLTERSIESLFQDFLGVTPCNFLKWQRMYGVRRALSNSSMAAGVVKRHALDWGFWHLGHFARDYRLLFGESPSDTLARRP